jgi:ATP-dependent RNA helicase RhlE
MPFNQLGLDDRILKAVQDSGYTEPTPIQAAAIPEIIAGHDLIGIAQTGTGKTAAFTLPMLTRFARSGASGRTRALVLAPTRELVAQIEENVRGYAKYMPVRVATVFGGVGERPQMRALKSGVDLVIAAPGRLLDLMGQGYGDFSALDFLVLDEADRMLDMGFLPSIRRIVKALPKKRQTLLFSATLSREIESLTHDFQQSPKTVQIGRRSNPAETVAQFVYEVPKHLKLSLLVHLLGDPAMNMVIVFSRTKHGADRIARKLEQVGITCAALHSNRSQNQRLRALKAFKDGDVRVLVATDIAARGIDVDGISHVVNFDFPMHAEDYVHRIGRTGRAQAIGDAISFVMHEDQAALKALERFIGRGITRKRAEGFDYNAASTEPREKGQPRPQSMRQKPPVPRDPPAGGGGGRNKRGGWRPRRGGGGGRP